MGPEMGIVTALKIYREFQHSPHSEFPAGSRCQPGGIRLASDVLLHPWQFISPTRQSALCHLGRPANGVPVCRCWWPPLGKPLKTGARSSKDWPHKYNLAKGLPPFLRDIRSSWYCRDTHPITHGCLYQFGRRLMGSPRVRDVQDAKWSSGGMRLVSWSRCAVKRFVVPAGASPVPAKVVPAG